MKATRILSVISSIGLLFCCSARAQDAVQIRFQATCRTTNDAGNIVRKVVTSQSLIRQCAAENGVTNRSRLRLFYRIGSDQNGDTIDVVDRKASNIVCTKFKLLFPLATIANTDGTETVQLAKVFGDQQSEEIGTATIRKVTDARGRIRVDGTINYFLLADGTNTTASVCSGSFTSGSTRTMTIQLPPF